MDGAVVNSAALDCLDVGITTVEADPTDCDDDNAAVNPGERDLTGDEVDSDCDGVEMCYADLDGDGYRTADRVESEDEDCEDEGEARSDAPLVDCDDTLASVNPGAEEIEGDGLDQDCDGIDPAGADDTATSSGEDGAVDVTVTLEGGADSAAASEDKGGCSTAGSTNPARLSWFLGLGLILGFRRRD